jgi:hypothetical protein
MERAFFLSGDVAAIVEQVASAVHRARHRDDPFRHLQLADVFPADIYAAMLAAMPVPQDYRPMSGRTRYTRLEGGGGTRTKIDLFPEFIRHLPSPKQPVWRAVSRALCSAEVREAFRQGLSPALEKRFGPGYRSLGLYPIPILTRDVAGYEIGIHPDTRSKAITVQLYLPADRALEHTGTVFHRRSAGGEFERARQMPFAPNSGYAFAVGEETYHSVDRLGPEVRARDSILLTYFLDESALDRAKNRIKRLANLVRNEYRSVAR